MGGSASKDITFSDLESSVNNKNNDSKNKNTKENQANSQKNSGSQNASKNLKNSANKNKSSGNTKNMEQIEEKESENNKEEDENENEEDEKNENEEKEEEEEDEEKEEEKTKKDEDKDKGEETDKKGEDNNKEEETEKKEDNNNNNKGEETDKKEESNIKEEKTEKNEEDNNKGEETEKKEDKETQEKKDNENKEGEGEGEDEEYTNQDDEISNIKSFLENEKKKKVKGERLNIPRQPKNGEKFLEGNIVYKKIEKPESIKEQSQENEEEEKDDSKLDEVEKLKKKKMLREYDFYLTKEINKNKFVNKNKDSNLPMDFATKVENKNQVRTYLCFVEAKTKKKKKIEIKPNKDNLLIRDEIYLFNERRKQIKSIKPLTQEEFIQPYSYKVEFEMGKKGISNKVENKTSTHDNFEYLDVYPNGEAYKFKPNDSIDEKEEEPVKVKVENAMDIKETINTAQVEENQKKDENDIVNIINKGLQENKLVEEEKKAENANDF